MALLLGIGVGTQWPDGERAESPPRAEPNPSVDTDSRTVAASDNGTARRRASATESPSADGSVTRRTDLAGIVRDLDGDPLSGAKVVLLEGDGGAWNERSSLVTDDTGRFRFDGVRDPQWQVSAHFEDLFFLPRHPKNLGSRERGDLELSAQEGHHTALDLRLPDGTTPDRAELRLQWNRTWRALWTPASPSICVPQGLVTIRALTSLGADNDSDSDAGSLDLASEAGAFRIRAQDEGPLRIELSPRTSLEISIRSEFARLDDLLVALARPNPNTEGAPFSVRGYHSPESGKIEIGDVLPGEIELRFVGRANLRRTGSTNYHVERHRIEAGQRNLVAVELPPPDPRDFLVVSCVDSTDRLLPECSFGRLDPPATEGGRPVRQHVTPFALGDRRLLFDREHLFGPRTDRSFERDEAVLIAHHTYFGTTVLTLQPDQESAEIVFGRNCSLDVTVENLPDTTALAGSELQVRIAPSTETSTGTRATFQSGTLAVDDSGIARYPQLSTGTYRCVLQLSQQQSTTPLELAAAIVELQPGPNQVTLIASGTHPLLVTSSNLPPGQSLSLRGPLGDPATPQVTMLASLDENRQARFATTTPGRFRLGVGDLPGSYIDIELPLQSCEFSPRPFDCLDVVRQPPFGQSTDQGLLNGDRIVAINDQAIESFGPVPEVLPFEPGTELRLRVLRGERTVDLAIEINPLMLRQRLELGYR
ncbi:MAG: carboxypeptidase regulatory-like domain-containing protein [Planctomycetota bacterium]